MADAQLFSRKIVRGEIPATRKIYERRSGTGDSWTSIPLSRGHLLESINPERARRHTTDAVIDEAAAGGGPRTTARVPGR